jgi:glycosyltransferase involved in cell wall biosynthesis
MRKLRIAEMVTGHFTTPPPEGIIYAPMDIAVAISKGLIKRGHEVTFYAPEGSKIEGIKIESCGLFPLKKDATSHPILSDPFVGGAEVAKIFNLWDQYLISYMFKEAERNRYDILHIHPPDRALPIAFSHPNISTIYTLHDPIYPWRAEVFRMFKSENQFYVSISDAQRAPASDLNYIATIYNGIPLESFQFSEAHDNYLLFVGRLVENKGAHEAILAAKKIGEKLLIIGEPHEGEYWDTKIKPYLDDKIRYIGFVPREELAKYYQKAKATLFPIKWEEPFGLVMVESMACGTPVIAFRRGSVPEVIKDGKTGFIVNTVEEMVEAIKKIETIDRKATRKYVEENFSEERMVENYEKAFLEIFEKKLKQRS